MSFQSFSYDSIRISYIFSFFIGAQKKSTASGVPKYDKIILKWNTSKKDKQLKDIIIDEIIQKNIYTNFGYHESEEWEPLNVRSAIYFKFPHFSISKSWQKVEIKFPFKDRIVSGDANIHIALFETGMGLMWTSLQFNAELSIEELHSLNNRKNLPFLTYSGEDFCKTISIHELFYNEISQLVDNFNQIFSKQFPEYSYCWNSKFWEDVSNEYYRGMRVYQEPSIALFIKSKSYLELDSIPDATFNLFVSSIMHSEGVDSIDIDHAKEHIGSNSTNLYPTKKFLTNLHGNCLLVVHNEEYENPTTKISAYNLFKEFTYGIFRTYCAVRGTWHVYNMLNEEIEVVLQELNSKIDNGQIAIDMSKEVKQYIQLKSHFLQMLNSEDPFVRGVGLTPFSKIYEVAVDIYKPNNIIESIKYKLNEYDKLIHSINTFNYFNISIVKSKSKIPSMLIYAIIITVFTLIIWLNDKKLINFSDPTITFIAYIFIGLVSVFSLTVIVIYFRSKFKRGKLC